MTTRKIYDFLLQSIRDADQHDGQRFVERFLQGPQESWIRTDAAIRALPSLWSASKCPAAALPYLKWIVGWTSELDHITDELDEATLRRLIAASVPFWKVRGEEGALTEILQLTTAARVRTWSWFDMRFVVGETALGEDHQGHDSWMLEPPGHANRDESRMNVRIVDDGTLNRRLVRSLVRLTRPMGERIRISYLGFLDLFTIDDDASQWERSAGATPPVVSGGIMTLSEGCSVHMSAPGATAWSDYVFTARVRGTYVTVEGYRTDADNKYLFVLNGYVNRFQLRAVVAGANTLLHTVELAPFLIELVPTLFYALRVELVPEGGATRIRVSIDGIQVLNVTHNAHAAGSIGVAGQYSPTTSIDVDEVEMFFNPLNEDEVTG